MIFIRKCRLRRSVLQMSMAHSLSDPLQFQSRFQHSISLWPRTTLSKPLRSGIKRVLFQGDQKRYKFRQFSHLNQVCSEQTKTKTGKLLTNQSCVLRLPTALQYPLIEANRLCQDKSYTIKSAKSTPFSKIALIETNKTELLSPIKSKWSKLKKTI